MQNLDNHTDTIGMDNNEILDGSVDPDAQVTVNDFIDYTEYLHSDVVRSLTLIHKLDENYTNYTISLDSIAKEYTSLKPSSITPNGTNNLKHGLLCADQTYAKAEKLRKDMAEALNMAIIDREESVAEASRLYDTVDRHFNRLSDIVEKLQDLASKSVFVQEESTRSLPEQANDKLRITLRLDNQRPTIKTNKKLEDVGSRAAFVLKTPRSIGRPPSRKRTYNNPSRVSKKHIAAIIDGTTSEEDWEDVPSALSDENSTLHYYESESGEQSSWLKLTQTELAGLRKQMKKNSTWQPSDTMMLKQLDSLGRGARGLRKWATRTGQDMSEVNRLIQNIGLKGSKFEFIETEEDIAQIMKEKRETLTTPKVDPKNKESPADSEERGRRNTKAVIPLFKESPVLSPVSAQSERPRRESVINKRKNSVQENKKSDIVLIRGISKAEHKAKGRRASQPTIEKSSKPLTSTTMDVIDDDMPFDENEPLYCLCHKPQYGTMVQCDREDCQEWYHLECVNLKDKPAESIEWICPLCQEAAENENGGGGASETSRGEVFVRRGKKRRKLAT